MIEAIIIDDERIGRETLRSLLEQCCPSVHVAGMADSVASGREMIEKCSPDLVFLDIEMPFVNGFELLATLPEKTFEVVFTTAYDQYALRAIKAAALDYLLKPIDRDELIAAVAKAEQKLGGKRTLSQNIEVLLANLRHASPEHSKIALPTDDGLILVQMSDIIRCEADGNYTRFHLVRDEQILVSRTMKEFDTILGEKDFLRVHHSHLVNMAHVRKYLRGEGGFVIMSDSATIPVSRRRKDELIRRLSIV
ncbi:MAG: response regulator transcription factor [Bacteroidetes bacterium]|nr:response regulator transcription factor [Bacteroidota bacterium]